MNRTEYHQAVAEYIENLQALEKSKTTIETYKRSLRIFGEFLEAEQLEANRESVLRWRNELSTTTNTKRQYLKEVNKFSKWLAKEGKIKEPFLTAEDIPQSKDGEQVMLTAEEIEKILAEVENPTRFRSEQYPLRTRAMVAVLLYCGLRNTELRTLRLRDLQFRNGYIFVRHGKGGKNRLVPFPEQVQKAIKDYLLAEVTPKIKLNKSSVVFGTVREVYGVAGEWRAMSAMMLNKIIKRFVMNVCGKEVHTHTLRHCAASLWDNLGVPIRDVQQALGHSSVTTTEKVYVHILNKNKAAKVINNVFAALI